MKYLTGEELRKTLGWWLVFSLFAAVVGVTYIRTLDSSPPGSVTSSNNATYDYVIVGGGTAGCVLASRLSDDPRVTVLLLEAGGEETENLWNHVPLWSPVSSGVEGNWEYLTVPQKFACKAAKNKRCQVPLPKVLGGSSLTNRMLYTRGAIADFSSWPKDKAGTWKYENILPYFLKSEDMLIEDLKISDHHSSHGPVPVSTAMPEITDLHNRFLQAGKELKYKTVDCNGQHNLGFCQLHTTVKDGQRFSAARDYLRTILSRKNLHVSVHSMAIKVLISKNKAVGVEYIRNGRKRTVGANKEVVLSAGAIGTAQLLMLSGIGPKQHLEKIGIPVVSDLPVGSSLQDHMVFKMDVLVNESIAITRNRAFNTLSYLQYFLLGKGVLSTSAGLFGNALLKTDPASKQPKADVQILFSAVTDGLVEPKTKVEGGKVIHMIMPSESGNTTDSDAFSIAVELLRPRSRGSVQLQNNNPFSPPLIDPNYLSAPKDTQMLIRGIKIATLLLNTSPFKAIKAKLSERPYSPCIQHRLRSDAYWDCVLRHMAKGNNQLSSTCPLGAMEDKTAVVDTYLRVKNVDNLRVADTSVLPTSISADISITTIMIAEKAADLIRGRDSVKWFRKISDRVTKPKKS